MLLFISMSLITQQLNESDYNSIGNYSIYSFFLLIHQNQLLELLINFILRLNNSFKIVIQYIRRLQQKSQYHSLLLVVPKDLMNIAELNFTNRQKIARQVILPHPPTYVIEGKQSNHQFWYFTSEHWLTLKKKTQNTRFQAFLKSKHQPKQSQQQSNSVNQYRKNDLNLPTVPSLLFLIKQNKNYLQSKIKHILTNHSSSQHHNCSSPKCPTCQQIEHIDYDFLLIERNNFCDLVQEVQKKDHLKDLDTVVDRVMQKILVGKEIFKQKDNERVSACIIKDQTLHYENQYMSKIPKSTFNPYIQQILSHEGFKYSISRLESIKQKYHYMTANTNRVNYRKQLNSNSVNNQFIGASQKTIDQTDKNEKNNINQDSPQKLAQKISSVLWTQEFLLFDVQKESNKTFSQQKVMNSHMKQKLSQKCESVCEYLQSHFRKIFIQIYKKEQESKVENDSDFEVKVKQLRLWYLNNNMRNNHCYTICVSDVKVEFIVGDQRWIVDFWTRIQLGLKDEIISTEYNICQRADKAKLFKGIRLKDSRQNPLKGQNHLQQKILQNNQSCQCCQSSPQQGSELSTYIKQRQNQNQNISAVKRVIIRRHIPQLKRQFKQVLKHKLQQLEQQLISAGKNKEPLQQRTNTDLKKQNSRIVTLMSLKDAISRIDGSQNLVNDAKKQKSIRQEKRSVLDKELNLELYDEVFVCEACYQLFLTIMKGRDKQIFDNKSIITMNTIKYSRPKSSKLSSKVSTQTVNTQNHVSFMKKDKPLKNKHTQDPPKQRFSQHQEILFPSKHQIKSFMTHKNESMSTRTIQVTLQTGNFLYKPSVPKTRPSSNYRSVAHCNRVGAKENERTQVDSEWSKTDFSEFEQTKANDGNGRCGDYVKINQELISLQARSNYLNFNTHCKAKLKYSPQQSDSLSPSQYIMEQNQNGEAKNPKPRKTRLQRFEEKMTNMQD